MSTQSRLAVLRTAATLGEATISRQQETLVPVDAVSSMH